MSENSDIKKYLTTSQAAKLLSVSPDTVLKWVKAGKIKSYRTLGGHFRIPADALGLNGRHSGGISGHNGPFPEFPTHLYCWEYLANGGDLKSECYDCITYRSRASRCYELRDIPGGFGCARMLCQDDCSMCDYYRLVNNQGINILIISRADNLLKDRESLNTEHELEIEFVDNEYKAGMVIQSFRPDFIILDCSIGKRQASSLCGSLFDDPRIPVPRVILTSKSHNMSDYCEKEVFGWIRKPFTLRQLKNCIKGGSIDNNL